MRRGIRGTPYLNGKETTEVRVASDKPVVRATSNFRLGNWVLGGREFSGIVDESFTFSRPLEAEEIESIYKRGFEHAQVVRSQGKAATTCGKIKSWHQ